MLILIVGSTTIAAVRNYRVNKFHKEQMKKRKKKEKPHSDL